MKYPISAIFLVGAVSLPALGAPSSQVLLAQLKADAIVSVTPISEAKGYNNQPNVVKNGVYFTKQLTEKNNKQTDLFFYDFATKKSKNITNTKEVSEYSPTLIPNTDSLSAVVVEQDSGQKLWQYPLDSKKAPARLFNNHATVGYHAWGKNNDLILFALGEPHTLQYMQLNAPQKMTKLASNIGRTLTYNPNTDRFSFSFSNKKGEQWFSTFNANNNQVTPVFTLPKKVQDYTWFSPSTILYAKGAQLIKQQVKANSQAQKWLDLSPYCQGTVTRLSYHTTTQKLAFVCQMP